MKYLLLTLILLMPACLAAQIKAGEEVKEWPRVGLAFSEEQGLEALAPLFAKISVKTIDPKKSKVKVPFESKDFGYGRKLKEDEEAKFAKAKAGILQDHGWLGWVENPSKEHAGSTAILTALKNGYPVLAAGDTGALVETDYRNSRRMWIEWSREVDGKREKTEFLLFLRATEQDKWTLNFDGFRTMADEVRGIGAQATFELFQLLKPISVTERLMCAYMCAKTLKTTPYPWWNYEVYADVLPAKQAGTFNTFFSYFLSGAEEAELTRATWLYCYLFEIKTPAGNLELVEGCGLLPPDAAKRVKEVLEDKEGITFHHVKNLRSTKIKALLKEEKAKLEEK